MELTDACIARAEALEPTLHAYITRTFEPARWEAKTAEADIAAGRYRGGVHGIPFAIKDLYETAGVKSTAGSKLLENYVPAEDAHTVARLKEAGVVMLGKLNLHEWAMGGTNVQTWYETPRNPWDTERVTGGSSGGSGAAIAAGYCYGSLGSDTRGSIRIPASLCGISGIKGTWGRVSIRGVFPLTWSLDHAGPMARTARDCALILQTIAGWDPRDPTTSDRPVPDYVAELASTSLQGLRIGVARNWFFDEEFTVPEVAEPVLATRAVFESLGATVRDVECPGPLDWDASAAFGAETAAYHIDNVTAHPEAFSDAVRSRVQQSASITGMDYQKARYQQLVLQQGLRVLFQDIDLLLTPTSPVPPMRISDVQPWQPGAILARNTSPFNVAGVPCISIPCGFDSNGLPVGLSLAGRWWEEGPVLRAANAYQSVTDWHKKRPPL